MCKRKTEFLHLPVKYSSIHFRHQTWGWMGNTRVFVLVRPRMMWSWQAAVQNTFPRLVHNNIWVKAVLFAILYVNRD